MDRTWQRGLTLNHRTNFPGSSTDCQNLGEERGASRRSIILITLDKPQHLGMKCRFSVGWGGCGRGHWRLLHKKGVKETLVGTPVEV